MIRRPLHVTLFTAVVLTVGFGCNTGSGRRYFGPGSTGATNSGTGGGGGGGGGGGVGGVGSFSPASDMSLTRALHTATVLQNGNVLVTCGENATVYLSSSELYDPVADAWQRVDLIAPTQSAGLMIDPATGNATGRSRHRATLLPNGQVLITGGFGAERFVGGNPVFEALGSTYLFDPATLTFSPTLGPALAENRHSHYALLVGTGSVVVTSGFNNITPVPLGGGVNQIGDTTQTTEVYDINTGMWTTVSPHGGTHTAGAAGIVAGTFVLVGGADIGFTDVGGFVVGAAAFSAPRAEIFDAQNGSWQAGPQNNDDRSQPAWVVTSNGNMFLAGGRDAGLAMLDTTEYLDAGNNTWVVGPTMNTARAGAEAAEIGTTSDVLVTGGFDPAGGLTQRQCEVYGVLNNAILGTVDMSVPRIMHRAVTLQDGRILITGGQDGNNNYYTQCETHSR